MRTSPLLTDLYQLTMLAGYFEEKMADKHAVFDLYFRTHPFGGGYAVFAGLEPALTALEGLRFLPEEIAWLRSLKLFKPDFLHFLEDFRFRGDITAPPEGSLVFAHEPLMSVEGKLAEVQLVETLLLNIINFQTLVATKAARICHAAKDASVVEFGLRRAQGPDGGLSASRAACIGGVLGTSNLLAGMTFGLPVYGTHAHSWVQSFSDELSAFRAYAAAFPDSTVLLVDTYDTLKSGLPNAITVARELREKGQALRGIRLDSGDLAWLSRKARQMLDEAGLPDVAIFASNDLDEHVISSIRAENGRVDVYGAGTRLSTAAGEGGGALGGVYKLVWLDGEPRMKITADIAKTTLPGKKRVFRAVGPEGEWVQDLICLHDEALPESGLVYDPTNPLHHRHLPGGIELVDLHRQVMRKGQPVFRKESLQEMAGRCRKEMALLPEGCLRFINPHKYKVSISESLKELRCSMIRSRAGEREY
ncbi:nicotinate phosphoribosyltransferase [Desulfobotulus sp. H1]|uniref:Nicotinate phosphoribosyltransferase n=1 Tax=Desulfobotulus pelophilus TaxID=2823377 RepID=A0ABT3NA87_9BACT|nr:nicotinate phosphoribosyltransferase [Desulfobotulus pelophilus]MCW7754368.1 nicotinate phosphoribosyltransferase [Desulfobotulus pelophilus]